MFQVKYINQLDNWSENAAQCPWKGQETLARGDMAKLQRGQLSSRDITEVYVVVKH